MPTCRGAARPRPGGAAGGYRAGRRARGPGPAEPAGPISYPDRPRALASGPDGSRGHDGGDRGQDHGAAGQFGPSGVETRPLSLWNSPPSADRSATPHAISAAVTVAALTLSMVMAGISARSRRLGNRTRRMTVMIAQAQVTTTPRPDSTRAATAMRLGPAPGWPPVSRAAVQTAPSQPSGATMPTASGTAKPDRRSTTNWRRTVQARGAAPASTARPARAAPPRRTPRERATAACVWATASNAAPSRILATPAIAIANAIAAQATVATGSLRRSGRPRSASRARRAPRPPRMALPSSRPRAGSDSPSVRSSSSAQNSSR